MTVAQFDDRPALDATVVILPPAALWGMPDRLTATACHVNGWLII